MAVWEYLQQLQYSFGDLTYIAEHSLNLVSLIFVVKR